MAAGVSAQGLPSPDPFDSVYQLNLLVPQGIQDVKVNGQTEAILTFQDLSRDGTSATSTLPLPAGTPQQGALPHTISFTAVPVEPAPKGWAIEPIAGFQTRGGETREVPLKVTVTGLAEDPYLRVLVTAKMHTQSGRDFFATGEVAFYTQGLAGFSIRSAGSLDLKPRELGDTGIILRNGGVQDRVFSVELRDNPCGLKVVPPASRAVPGVTETTFAFSIQGPESRPWYISQDCSLLFDVTATDNPGLSQTASIGVTVNGGYLAPEWVFWFLFILLLILLILLLAKRRKDRIEEEILGKPQKPWTIPVEAVYLRHLRQKDPRAWYVVRHHLMEEEYRSSLLWYKAYKQATKGSRKKERLIVAQERQYERWKAKWAKRIAQPMLEADRMEARLQRKLSRKAARRHDKKVAKLEAKNAKIEAAHANRQERETAAWEKAAAKAEAKGRPLPDRPTKARTDLHAIPPQPEDRLSEHRWGRKAERFRKRRVREQGNLEVKFEKADARKLAKLRRKVQRIAQKLDDPQFVAEHPLLQKA